MKKCVHRLATKEIADGPLRVSAIATAALAAAVYSDDDDALDYLAWSRLRRVREDEDYAK